MTHPEFTTLDAFLDGELGPVEGQEMEAHLARCPACVRFRDERQALRAAIAADLPPLHASDTLRARVRTALREAAPSSNAGRFPRAGWRTLAFAATLVVVAFGSWRIAERRAAGTTIGDAVLASHIRSLMPGHLTDVVSTDQHTVKPWFNGRLDFSPPVPDFARQGYPLVGGRIDYIAGRPVAALVYGRRQHLINVFVWPSPEPWAPATALRQGYHLLHWATPAYAYWVVSDLGTAELNDFAQLIRNAQ